MAASETRPSAAGLLLERIPDDKRVRMVRQVMSSLDLHSSNTDVDFAASLLQHCADTEAMRALLQYLQNCLHRGDIEKAALLCSGYPDVAGQMLNVSIYSVSKVAREYQQGSSGLLAVPMLDSMPCGTDQKDYSLNFESTFEPVICYLKFISKTPSSLLTSGKADELALACLVFLGAADDALCHRARDALFGLFTSHPITASSNRDYLWSRVKSLVSAQSSFHQTLGLSVWLRWITSDNSIDRSLSKHDAYWALLATALRNGDFERWKSCLRIFRASIDAFNAISDFPPSMVAASLTPISLSIIHSQYHRFCTVFETIILGRYLNQVQECEPDLDLMASSQTYVQPSWLYVLLGSAMDSQMQDSNRKFIGNWMMRSEIYVDDVGEFLKLFRDSFLPWATQGHLFTSSLRKKDGVMECQHGDRLANYVSRLLQDHANKTEIVKSIMDSTLRVIKGNHGHNFAYAKLYTLEGIGKALDSETKIPVEPNQLAVISQSATNIALPELGRDCVFARCCKISYDLTNRSPSLAYSETISTAAKLWPAIEAKANSVSLGKSALTDGTIASLNTHMSQRDIYEQQTMQKCIDFKKELQDESCTFNEASGLEEKLSDIWSDLEYLEYPRWLVMVMPALVLNPNLIQATHTQTSGSIRHTLSTVLQNLLRLCQTRVYLLSPLLEELRKVVLKRPQQAELLNLENTIVYLSEPLSQPTIDMQLEDAAASLLCSMSDALNKFGYEYYFQHREGYGIAALLDLVSRLGMSRLDITKAILDRLLLRWAQQKTPPPTVSLWKSTAQLQVMLICAEQTIPNTLLDDAMCFLKNLHYMLAIEPLPRYRYLLEWMIARVYVHHDNLRKNIFDELRTKDHHSNPKFLASLMKIGVMIAKTESSSEEFALQLARIFVPLAASSKVVVRHEAQWQIPVLLDCAKERSWKSISDDAAFTALDEFIRSLERFGDPPFERQVDKLDPIKDHTFTHLVEGPWCDLDHIEPRLCRREDFLMLYASDSEGNNDPNTYPASCMILGSPISGVPKPQEIAVDHDRKILQNIDNISRAFGSGPGPTALQTKGNAHLESSRSRHNNLLVVASLVDNPYNLGGLSRVSEIFGAGAMYLQNLNVTSNKDFKGVSVSSHLNFPIRPLLATHVSSFLATRKQEEGFSVVGIEQTDRSVLLGSADCILPEKCVLVIGSEREGIPALVLSECDILVEIPQLGITRSLNVQTAAAIVLCEYAKQHRR